MGKVGSRAEWLPLVGNSAYRLGKLNSLDNTRVMTLATVVQERQARDTRSARERYTHMHTETNGLYSPLC